MFDLTALGELLIDFSQTEPCGASDAGGALFERNAGGAPANVACACAKLNLRAAFIGKVGSDGQGRFLAETLARAGVDTRGVRYDASAFTTLAFVSIAQNGERAFDFARRPGADTRLRTGELDAALLSGTRVLHVGSLSLTNEPARGATYAAVRMAREAGATVSFDPNYRPALWKGARQAAREIRAMLPYADIVKLSEEETELAAGVRDPLLAAKTLVSAGVRLAVVTLGARGALAVAAGGAEVFSPGFSVRAVDTTGAGDAFFGALLGFLLEHSLLSACPADALMRALRFANAAGALCTQKRGAIPALADKHAILAFLRANAP